MACAVYVSVVTFPGWVLSPLVDKGKLRCVDSWTGFLLVIGSGFDGGTLMARKNSNASQFGRSIGYSYEEVLAAGLSCARRVVEHLTSPLISKRQCVLWLNDARTC